MSLLSSAPSVYQLPNIVQASWLLPVKVQPCLSGAFTDHLGNGQAPKAISSTGWWSQYLFAYSEGLICVDMQPMFPSLISARHCVFWYYLNMSDQRNVSSVVGGRCVKPAKKAASSCLKERLTRLKELQLSMKGFSVPWCSRSCFTTLFHWREETGWERAIVLRVVWGISTSCQTAERGDV